MVTGRVVRFDEVRGYGFIALDEGGEDVFVHANDLRDEKYLFRSGLRVGLEVEQGERGPKACDVRILEQPTAPAPRSHAPSSGVAPEGLRDDDDDIVCDVLTQAEFQQELTEALLDGVPTMTGEQIVQARRRVMELVKTHNWVVG